MEVAIVLWVIAGLLFAYAIWMVVKTHFALGEPYNRLRGDLEGVRWEMERLERKSPKDWSEERFAEMIKVFNLSARKLRVKRYE